MTNRTTAACAAGLCAIGLAVPATAAAKPDGRDAAYLKTAASGDRFEIAGGALAVQRGQSAQAKAVGARLAKDHSRSYAETRTLANALGARVSAKPTPLQDWQLGVIRGASAADFDRAYLSLEVADHRVDIEETRTEARFGTDPRVRALARKELPTLRTHLRLARAALKAIGG
jgi:predicted outer membrane protein